MDRISNKTLWVIAGLGAAAVGVLLVLSNREQTKTTGGSTQKGGTWATKEQEVRAKVLALGHRMPDSATTPDFGSFVAYYNKVAQDMGVPAISSTIRNEYRPEYYQAVQNVWEWLADVEGDTWKDRWISFLTDKGLATDAQDGNQAA